MQAQLPCHLCPLRDSAEAPIDNLGPLAVRLDVLCEHVVVFATEHIIDEIDGISAQLALHMPVFVLLQKSLWISVLR